MSVGPTKRWDASGGFTLIEMLVVLGILAVIAAFTAPSFQTPLANSRVQAMTREFVSNLANARTQAARRGVLVTLCPRDTSTNTCKAGASNWNDGWVLYADTNASGTLDSSDQLLSVRSALPTGSSIGPGQTDPISVLPSGEHVFPTGASRVIAFESGASRRYVVISRVGRATVLTTPCESGEGCSQ